MNWIINNWYILIGFIALIVSLIYISIKFFKWPNKEQIKAIKEWLIYACMQAEKELGSKTGVLKLRYVYDMFIGKFPWLVNIISFEYFSRLVDEALQKMKEILEKNKVVKSLIEGD